MYWTSQWNLSTCKVSCTCFVVSALDGSMCMLRIVCVFRAILRVVICFVRAVLSWWLYHYLHGLKHTFLTSSQFISRTKYHWRKKKAQCPALLTWEIGQNVTVEHLNREPLDDVYIPNIKALGHVIFTIMFLKIFLDNSIKNHDGAFLILRA